MATAPLIDGHGRQIGDLRVSVTDRCNFRCQYCMPAEGLPWLERDDVLHFEEIERLVALMVSMGVRDVRLTGGEPLVRREFPRLAAMLAAIPGLEDLSLTTNGYLLERDAAALVDAGHQPLQRFDRLAPARPLLRDDAPRRAPPRAAPASRRWRPSPRPIRSRSTPWPCAASPRTRCCRSRSSRASTRTRSASSSSCRWTPTMRGRATRCSPARRSARPSHARAPARARAARALTPPPASTASPTAAGASGSSTRSPSPSAPTATASASPRTGGCAPACSRSTRPTCAARCATARPTRELEQIVRDAVWRKELKHHVNDPGFVQPHRTMSAIGG